MTQDQVGQFADLSGDHKFVHVDPVRAAESPFGGTIAHAMLSLSLLAPVVKELHVSDATTTINYGFDRVRFPAPLPVGGRWRGTAKIAEVTEIKAASRRSSRRLSRSKARSGPTVAANAWFGSCA